MKNENATIKISEELLEDWKIWMAIEVIQQLKQGNIRKDKTKFEKLFDSEKNVNRDFFKRYKQILIEKNLSLRQQYGSVKEIEILNVNLKDFYFNKLLIQLKDEAQRLINQETIRIKNIILSIAQKNFPAIILDWLNDSVNGLIEKRNRCDRLIIEYSCSSDSALNSYQTLSRSHKARHNLEARWNAMITMYTALLEKEINRTLSQIYNNCIQLCQTYSSYSESSKNLLIDIESSLREKSRLQITSIPVFAYLGKIDVDKQKQLLELWIGHNINHWGNAFVSWQQIEQQLLKNLTPAAESVFQEFCDRYLIDSSPT